MDDFEWNVINEGHLLDAMVGHKPVGINKYFQMALICEKFTNNLHKDIDSQKIWTQLETMYNLEVLDESESLPFPNSERDFSLPESDFATLISKKEEEKGKKSGRETPKKEETKPTTKEPQRRDSKEGKDNVAPIVKTPTTVAKKEMKKEPEKSGGKVMKGRNSSIGAPKEESTKGKSNNKNEETPKIAKRPTRGSLKPSNDDSGSSGKSSPITVTPTSVKRRRI